MQPGKHINAAVPPTHSRPHVVQFYEDTEFLCRTVAAFLAEGILAGQPVMVVATPINHAAIADYLANQEIDVECLREEGRYLVLDAHDLLSRFMVDAMPDRQLLEAAIGGAIEDVLRSGDGVQVRAYGEMVDLLWRGGNHEAAVRLEQLWNALAANHSFSLMCGYGMGGFQSEAHAQAFADICACHTQVLPAETYVRADSEDSRMREIARLQQRARSLQLETDHRKELESALTEALSQRRQAEMLLDQASRARDEFLSIVSRELNSPLNILHLQLMGILQAAEQGRQAYSPEWISYRIRQAAGGIRHISVLFENLQEVARTRTHGFDLQFEEGCLAGILEDIVERFRRTMREEGITTRLIGVAGRWDRRRIEHALTPLLSDAISHGPGTRVEVALEATPNTATILVTDRGENAGQLFDPEEGNPRQGAGSGLGLWIASQLVRAMGGNIAVNSGAGDRTTLFLTLPRRMAG